MEDKITEKTKSENGGACGQSTAPCYDIASKIEDAIHTFIIRYGQDPERLYLGTTEWVQLKNFADDFLCHKVEMMTNRSSMYNGLEIFVVCSDNHLFVA